MVYRNYSTTVNTESRKWPNLARVPEPLKIHPPLAIPKLLLQWPRFLSTKPVFLLIPMRKHFLTHCFSFKSVFNFTLQTQIVVLEITFISTVSTEGILLIHDTVIPTINEFDMCFAIPRNHFFSATKTYEVFLGIFKTFFP